jgi:ABC-type transporter Mla subunit MlaD
MYTKHAELKAGIVVLGAIAALLALLFFATGAELFKSKREIQIRFKQGFAAPTRGDSVQMLGVDVGRVSEVVQREERRPGKAPLTPEDRRWNLKIGREENAEIRELYVLATVELDRSQVIPKGTEAEISVTITGTRELALKPGLSPDSLSDEDTRLNPIVGYQAGDVGEITRKISGLVDKVGELVDSGKTIFGDARLVLQTLHEKVEAIEAAEISANVRDATATLKTTIGALQVRLDEIAANVSAASADLRVTAAAGKGLAEGAAKDVAELLATLKHVATQLDELIARSAPQVDAILVDLRRTAGNLAKTSEELLGVGLQVDAILADVGGDARRTFARLAEVGRNLQDASEDIKAHPWKLLNKPDAEEIAYENLRTAAQSTVRAAAHLDETSQRIVELLQRKDLPEEQHREALQQLMEVLKRHLAEYDRHAAVLDRLLRAGGGPPAPAQR